MVVILAIPQIKATAKWEFSGPDGKMIGCFKVPLQVRN